MEALIDALKTNASLRSLRIYGGSIAADGQHAKQLALVLENHNLTLEVVHGQFTHILSHRRKRKRQNDDRDWPRVMQMHTSFNSLGRNQVMKDLERTTKEEWVEALIKANVKKNRDSLLYLLQKNPLLCHLPDGMDPEDRVAG